MYLKIINTDNTILWEGESEVPRKGDMVTCLKNDIAKLFFVGSVHWAMHHNFVEVFVHERN